MLLASSAQVLKSSNSVGGGDGRVCVAAAAERPLTSTCSWQPSCRAAAGASRTAGALGHAISDGHGAAPPVSVPVAEAIATAPPAAAHATIGADAPSAMVCAGCNALLLGFVDDSSTAQMASAAMPGCCCRMRPNRPPSIYRASEHTRSYIRNVLHQALCAMLSYTCADIRQHRHMYLRIYSWPNVPLLPSWKRRQSKRIPSRYSRACEVGR